MWVHIEPTNYSTAAIHKKFGFTFLSISSTNGNWYAFSVTDFISNTIFCIANLSSSFST